MLCESENFEWITHNQLVLPPGSSSQVVLPLPPLRACTVHMYHMNRSLLALGLVAMGLGNPCMFHTFRSCHNHHLENVSVECWPEKVSEFKKETHSQPVRPQGSSSQVVLPLPLPHACTVHSYRMNRSLWVLGLAAAGQDSPCRCHTFR